jgi:hypothetical protein
LLREALTMAKASFVPGAYVSTGGGLRSPGQTYVLMSVAATASFGFPGGVGGTGPSGRLLGLEVLLTNP